MPYISQFKSRIISHFLPQSHAINRLISFYTVKSWFILIGVPQSREKETEIEQSNE